MRRCAATATASYCSSTIAFHEFKTLAINRPDGGREIHLLRFTDPPFLELFTIIFVKEFDPLYAKYKDSIVSVVNDSSLTVRRNRT